MTLHDAAQAKLSAHSNMRVRPCWLALASSQLNIHHAADLVAEKPAIAVHGRSVACNGGMAHLPIHPPKSFSSCISFFFPPPPPPSSLPSHAITTNSISRNAYGSSSICRYDLHRLTALSDITGLCPLNVLPVSPFDSPSPSPAALGFSGGGALGHPKTFINLVRILLLGTLQFH